MNDQRLKPCPFCGWHDVAVMLIEETEIAEGCADDFSVRCPECNSLGGNADTEEKAIEAWNRRSHQSGSLPHANDNHTAHAAHVEYHRKASAQAHKKDFMHAAVSHDDAIARLAAGQWCGFDDCAGNDKRVAPVHHARW